MMIFETRTLSLSFARSNISNSIESVEAHENSNLWITKAYNFNQSTPRNSRGIAIKCERERIRNRLDVLTWYKKLALQSLKGTNENNNKEQSNNNWNIFRIVVSGALNARISRRARGSPMPETSTPHAALFPTKKDITTMLFTKPICVIDWSRNNKHSFPKAITLLNWGPFGSDVNCWSRSNTLKGGKLQLFGPKFIQSSNNRR